MNKHWDVFVLIIVKQTASINPSEGVPVKTFRFFIALHLIFLHFYLTDAIHALWAKSSTSAGCCLSMLKVKKVLSLCSCCCKVETKIWSGNCLHTSPVSLQRRVWACPFRLGRVSVMVSLANLACRHDFLPFMCSRVVACFLFRELPHDQRRPGELVSPAAVCLRPRPHQRTAVQRQERPAQPWL